MSAFDPNRRRLLLGGAATGLLLRGLATGLPPAFLVASRRARAQMLAPPCTLILSTSGRGDPVNCNAPGSYVDGAQNNPDPRMAPVDVQLGDAEGTGAQPWQSLPEALRRRLAFFHIQTRSVAHPEQPDTLAFRGSVKNAQGNGSEMLPSALAELAAPRLGTLQVEPVPLVNEVITVSGSPLQTVKPSELQALFADRDGALADLRATRDEALDRLYGDLRRDGSRAQRTFLDRYALSQTQARALGEQLSELLARLPIDPLDIDGPADQVIAAVAMARLQVSPAIVISLPFGGDNHNDADLTDEADQTIQSVGEIGRLWTELQAAELQDQVSFALHNVFGRGLVRNNAGGRNHNPAHSVMVAFGPRFRGGIYGGVTVDGCLGIDPATGAATRNGGIAATETMEAAGKTLAVALGHDREVINTRIQGGQVIEGALDANG